MIPIQSFDLDGVIYFGGRIKGLRPCKNDIIITGRSIEEKEETLNWLKQQNIHNTIYFNSLPFHCKTRVSSGEHKGRTLKRLLENGIDISVHYDDDEIQIEEIKKYVNIPIVHIKHDLIEKENVRHILK